jgi:hypothetical protein
MTRNEVEICTSCMSLLHFEYLALGSPRLATETRLEDYLQRPRLETVVLRHSELMGCILPRPLSALA